MKKVMVFVVVGVFLFGLSAVATAGVTPIGQPGNPFMKPLKPFPIVINRPGSYQLTSNLTVPNANTTAILVQTDNVTIDLNGFAIIGPGQSISTAKGIDATGYNNIKVMNGTIRGMGDAGISAGENCIIQGVIATNNGVGILVAGAATVSGNTANYNDGDGIFVGNGPVSNNTAWGNGGEGIHVNGNGPVSNNTTNNNGSDGIFVGNGSVSNNTADNNGGHGIFVYSNGTVGGNTALSNGDDGIRVGGIGVVSNNTANYNVGDGVDVLGGGTVSGNTAIGNNANGIDIHTGAATVSGNIANNNGVCGIDVRFGTVIGNTADFNSWGLHFPTVGVNLGYFNNEAHGNTIADVVGGHSGGNNFCSGGPC